VLRRTPRGLGKLVQRRLCGGKTYAAFDGIEVFRTGRKLQVALGTWAAHRWLTLEEVAAQPKERRAMRRALERAQKNRTKVHGAFLHASRWWRRFGDRWLACSTSPTSTGGDT
jgi:hypothetical protein